MRALPIVSLALLVTIVNGCGFFRSGAAYFQSLDHFHELSEGSGIYYEDGAKDAAVAGAAHFPASIEAVERRQYRPFKTPVPVYFCADEDSFAKYSGAPKVVRGAAFGGRLFLSPRATQSGTVKGILVHELSHLHFHQYVGNRRYVANVPSWFQEGLAVSVAAGAGAEKVSFETARESILSGRSFVPNASGSLLFPRTAFSFGLKPQMFYRQSAMFVGHLAQRDPSGFKDLIGLLLDDVAFETAFEKALGRPIPAAWEDFIAALEG